MKDMRPHQSRHRSLQHAVGESRFFGKSASLGVFVLPDNPAFWFVPEVCVAENSATSSLSLKFRLGRLNFPCLSILSDPLAFHVFRWGRLKFKLGSFEFQMWVFVEVQF